MIWYSNVGWIYLSNNKAHIMLEFKNIFKYFFILKNIKKIKKDSIEVDKIKKIKMKTVGINMLEIKEMYKNNKKIYKLLYEKIIDNNNLDIKVVSWAMNIENEEVKKYKNNFKIVFFDCFFEKNKKIVFFIKDIKIEKEKNKIQIEYQTKDCFLVYMIINEYYELYEYNEKISIKLGNNFIKWGEKKRLEIENIFKNILENKKCCIISKSYINYNIGIWYDGEDLTRT
jgi:hypothetical protein